MTLHGLKGPPHVGRSNIAVPSIYKEVHVVSKHFPFRHKLTPLKVSLCLLVVTGVILVVQPSFIFGENQNFINTTEYTQETSILPKLPEYNMTLGRDFLIDGHLSLIWELMLGD